MLNRPIKRRDHYQRRNLSLDIFYIIKGKVSKYEIDNNRKEDIWSKYAGIK